MKISKFLKLPYQSILTVPSTAWNVSKYGIFLVCISLYSDQKKLRIWALFMQCRFDGKWNIVKIPIVFSLRFNRNLHICYYIFVVYICWDFRVSLVPKFNWCIILEYDYWRLVICSIILIKNFRVEKVFSKLKMTDVIPK